MNDGSRRGDGIDDRIPLDDSVARLCAIYDRLLADDGAALEAEGSAELRAMAGIFDIDADRPAREVWRDLRAVLVRQSPVAEEQASFAPLGEPLTLMLVEDDADMAQDLTEALTEAGHHVVGPFHDAEAAEVSAALYPFDLALLDINLSGADTGADLARTLRDRWGVPSLFLSGDVSATARHAGLVQGIVLKPYRVRDVLDAVARATQPSDTAPQQR